MNTIFNYLSTKDAINLINTCNIDINNIDYKSLQYSIDSDLYIVHSTENTDDFYDWCKINNVKTIDDSIVEKYLKRNDKTTEITTEITKNVFKNIEIFKLYSKAELFNMATMLHIKTIKSCNKNDLIFDISQSLIEIEPFLQIEIDNDKVSKLKTFLTTVKIKKSYKKIPQEKLLNIFIFASTLNRIIDIDNTTWFNKKITNNATFPQDIFKIVTIL